VDAPTFAIFVIAVATISVMFYGIKKLSEE